jgi:hypothetical protein
MVVAASRASIATAGIRRWAFNVTSQGGQQFGDIGSVAFDVRPQHARACANLPGAYLNRAGRLVAVDCRLGGVPPRLGQRAPLWRFPQPASRCARPGAGRDLFLIAGGFHGAGFAGAVIVPAGKHLSHPGTAGVRAPVLAARTT